MTDSINVAWLFNSQGRGFPSAVFQDQQLAIEWIAKHKLTGISTCYPLNIGVYDWAIENKLFKPKDEEHYTPEFIGRFTSASMEHDHFEEGKLAT